MLNEQMKEKTSEHADRILELFHLFNQSIKEAMIKTRSI
jgi:hypothetical protein